MKQSLDLDSLVRTQAQDSLHSAMAAAEDRKDRAYLPSWCLGLFFASTCTGSCWSLPPSPSGPEPSCMHLGRGLVAVSSSGSTATVQTRSASPPPSSTQPQGPAAEGAAPPITELILPRPGRMWETQFHQGLELIFSP